MTVAAGPRADDLGVLEARRRRERHVGRRAHLGPGPRADTGRVLDDDLVHAGGVELVRRRLAAGRDGRRGQHEHGGERAEDGQATQDVGDGAHGPSGRPWSECVEDPQRMFGRRRPPGLR